MPILIIEHLGQRQAGTLNGRVLIGRWPDNTVVINDKAVSRIHAWIGQQDGRYYVADAGSRTGTFVNGEVMLERHVLRDGDQIRIGPALLKYRTDPVPPGDAGVIDLTPRPADELTGGQGKFIDCVCGAPLWMPNNFVGKGECRYCGHEVVRSKPPAKASPAAPPNPPAAAFPPPSAPIPRLAPKLSASGVRPAINLPEPPPIVVASDEHLDALLSGASDAAIPPAADAPQPPGTIAANPPDAPIAAPSAPGELELAEPPAATSEFSIASQAEPIAPWAETSAEQTPAQIAEPLADFHKPAWPEEPSGDQDVSLFDEPAESNALPLPELPSDVHEAFGFPPLAESPELLFPKPPSGMHAASSGQLSETNTPRLPEPAHEPPPPAAQPPLAARDPNLVCGVCHAPITIFDEVTPCPACGLMFHCDCWHENRGCSAYGCPQVGALDENNTPA